MGVTIVVTDDSASRSRLKLHLPAISPLSALLYGSQHRRGYRRCSVGGLTVAYGP